MYFDEALSPDEAAQKLLYVLFMAALDQGFNPEQAEAFGIWTLCYVQYCQREEVPADAPHLPGFLELLRGHPEVTDEEKDRALDAVMFSLFDVFHGRIDLEVAADIVAGRSTHDADASTRDAGASSNGDPGSKSDLERHAESLARRSTTNDASEGGRLLTQLLFHTDLTLSEAVRLTTHDVDSGRALLRVGPSGETRIIPLPDHLREDVSRKARALQSSKDGATPLFPAAYEKYVVSSPNGDDARTATRVMQTLFLT